MNSFTFEIKTEAAASINNKKRSDACLLGMFALSEETESGSVVYTTDCEVSRDLFVRLVNHIAKNDGSICETVIRHRGRMPAYRLELSNRDELKLIQNRLGISDFDCESIFRAGEKLSGSNFGAFVAGIYLSCGRTDDPSKRYSLEFAPDSENSNGICRMLRELLSKRVELSPKLSLKSGRDIMYFRDSESIEDVLTLMGAGRSSLQIMQTKVYKDIRNRANRATNCDTANCDRQSESARKQLEAIKIIESEYGGLDVLDSDLKNAAELRLLYPEYSLSEISKFFNPPLTKSGANHRFLRLIELSKKIKLEMKGD